MYIAYIGSLFAPLRRRQSARECSTQRRDFFFHLFIVNSVVYRMYDTDQRIVRVASLYMYIYIYFVFQFAHKFVKLFYRAE